MTAFKATLRVEAEVSGPDEFHALLAWLRSRTNVTKVHGTINVGDDADALEAWAADWSFVERRDEQ